MIAIGLKSSCRHSQPKPSRISAPNLILLEAFDGAELLNAGTIVNINAAETKKVEASK
jgi:hypothetical protein